MVSLGRIGKISFQRIIALGIKEFFQLKRDRATLGMIFGLPLLQIILFGVVINNDSRNIRTVVVSDTKSNIVSSVTRGLINSGYFSVLPTSLSYTKARQKVQAGEVAILISFETDFDKKFFLKRNPKILVEADSSDPVTVGNAISNLQPIIDSKLAEFVPSFSSSGQKISKAGYNLILHRLFNSENLTNYNTIPGLIGSILTMTLIMLTSMAIVREKELGNMENLLATPISGLEVMTGKILPYILIGLLQALLILAIGLFIFEVPFFGNILFLLLCVILFIATNLGLGLAISTFAVNQVQSLQMSVFVFLPSLMLSGFIFPYRGMPVWAQYLGEIIPLTHFLRLIRGSMLKGAGIVDLLYDFVFLLISLIFILGLAILKFRKTLD